jgi:hypothetical protein
LERAIGGRDARATTLDHKKSAARQGSHVYWVSTWRRTLATLIVLAHRSPLASPVESGSRSLRHYCLRGSLLGLLVLVDVRNHAAWPGPAPAHAQVAASSVASGALAEQRLEDRDVAAIRAQPVCIASKEWSFGTLGETVLFVHQRRGDELRVGYFVHFDVERPWGHNLLTYTVLPATMIDATYSHFAFFLPGIQRALYGPGDVEGASVLYRVGDGGQLTAQSAVADDATHQRVTLTRDDIACPAGRVILMTNVWSHQLGAPGAASYANTPAANLRCFVGPRLQPLTREIASAFRLGSFEHPLRARPAFHRDPRP